jgi:membrane protease YdiL (CAAX protease family)
MAFPFTLVLLSIPSLIYIFVRRWHGDDARDVLGDIGWRDCSWADFLWGLGIAALVGVLSWLAAQAVPSDILKDPNLNLIGYAGLTVNARNMILIWIHEAIYIASGEEIFFRGFLGGMLIRRFGFAAGNTVQALIFLLPHLLVLRAHPVMFPLVIIKLISGWLLGWLYYHSESILPGWIAHSVANTLEVIATLM